MSIKNKGALSIKNFFTIKQFWSNNSNSVDETSFLRLFLLSINVYQLV